MTDNELYLIKILQSLTRGCTRHAYYKGKVEPKDLNCHECEEMHLAYRRWLAFCKVNGIESK